MLVAVKETRVNRANRYDKNGRCSYRTIVPKKMFGEVPPTRILWIKRIVDGKEVIQVTLK